MRRQIGLRWQARMDALMEQRMIRITWRDACLHAGRYTKEEAEKLTMPIYRTLGYRISQNEREILVAQEVNDRQEYRDIHQISAGCIVKVEELVLATPISHV